MEHPPGQPLPAAPRTQITVHAEDLVRVDNPLKIDGQQPELPLHGAGREDFAT
jgi:hypothetical protein